LTKNNFGHSTLSVNDALHRTEGLVTITDFQEGDKPEATLDMSATLGEIVKSASRKFTKDSPTSILIEDNIELNENTKLITWHMLTQADVEITDDGVILSQDGKKLKLENLSHPQFMVSVVSLYPAPLELDKQIENLKRLEIRIPAWRVGGDHANIKVRLTGL
jgi:hypothetical protein